MHVCVNECLEMDTHKSQRVTIKAFGAFRKRSPIIKFVSCKVDIFSDHSLSNSHDLSLSLTTS